jgi:GAF domain-containing protein
MSDDRGDLDEQGEAQRDGLAQSLRALAGLGSNEMVLTETLTKIAEFAVAAVPGAEGAGLTFIAVNGAENLVATHPFVSAVDAVQYRLREGPCITAAATRRTVLSRSLGEDPRWPTFGEKVAELGVHSALSLPLITPNRVVGALNIYAKPKAVFFAGAARLAEQFATPAAVTVQNAHLLASAQSLVTRVQGTPNQREVIDRAMGHLVGREGLTTDEALMRLRTLATSQHKHVAEIAAAIMAGATEPP